MEDFSYRDGEAFCESVPLSKLASELGTPLYVYSKASLDRHCRHLRDAFASYPTLPCYAVKANGNLSLIENHFLSRLRRRRRLARRNGASSRRRNRSPANRFFRCRQDERRNGVRPRRGNPLIQRGIPTGAGAAGLDSKPAWESARPSACGSTRISTPRPTRISQPACTRLSSESRKKRPARSFKASRNTRR